MNKKIMDKEGLLDINCGMERDIICIGNIEDKKGYNRVNVNLKFLKKAIDILLEKHNMPAAYLFVAKDKPIQIGKNKIGMIIAHRTPEPGGDDKYSITNDLI